jgi:hypothetical protein
VTEILLFGLGRCRRRERERGPLGSGELGFALRRIGPAALEQVPADQSKFTPVSDDKEERKRDTEGDESKHHAPKTATGGIVDNQKGLKGDEEAREQTREVLNVYFHPVLPGRMTHRLLPRSRYPASTALSRKNGR